MKKETYINRTIKTTRRLVNNGLYSLKRDGFIITTKKTLNVLGIVNRSSYRRWAKEPLYTEEQLREQRKESFDREIKFSIITPLYNTREEHLRDMLESVIMQTYPNWELCLVNSSDEEHAFVERICGEYKEKDNRIRYKKLKSNYDIADNSNACIEMAEGDYISLLDQDDVLHPAALHDVMEKICEEDADFIYTDEAIFNGSDLNDIETIYFKKDYAPDDLKAVNYIGRFTSVRKELLGKCGGFRDGFDGCHEHELFMRLTDAAEHIEHIPEVLYFRRTHGDFAAEASETTGYLPTASRISYELPENSPKVSIIIPNYEHVADLKTCVSSIQGKTTYDNYEIIIVENNSKDLETFECYEMLEREYDNIRVVSWPGRGFNWSAINNYAVREAASGDYLLFLNNDTEVISPDWIQEMMMYAQRPDVGVVGAMLYYPDDTVQHAGVIIGLGGIAGHAFSKYKRGEMGYMGRLSYAQDLSAVTGACMMIRREVYDQAGGMDEDLAVGLNDIDFCLKVRQAGYLIVWTPYAELYHYESKSRGINENKKDRIRTEQEKNIFCTRWADLLKKGDPYYNPNLSLMSFKFEPKLTNTKREQKDRRYISKDLRNYKEEDHTFAIMAYKYSPYLEECIKSIMSQTTRGNVIICTSTPNEYIDGLSVKYGIPVCTNELSGGIGSDWNFAYDQAQTRLVTLAHQDDVYEKDFVEKTLEKLSCAETPLIAFSDYYEIQESRTVTHKDFVNLRIKKTMLTPLKSKRIQHAKWMRRMILSFADPICCPSVTYVKDNLPDKLFDEELKGSIDWAAWESLSKRDGAFVYIPNMLMGHRMYEESSTLRLIDSGQRKQEDLEVLRHFWPDPIARAINVLYSQSQRKRKIKGHL